MSERPASAESAVVSMGVSGGAAQKVVEAILREEFALAKPDDLAYLEFQVPGIAHRIIARLGLRCGPSV